MKKYTNLFSVLFLLLGGAAYWLHQQIYIQSVDAMGLIIRGSWLEMALWALTAVAAVLAIVLSRKCTVQLCKPLVGVIGCLIYACGALTLIPGVPKGPEMLGLLYRGVAALTVVSMAGICIMRILGKEPHFALEIAPCILGILQLVECYQLWSERPLVLNYFFGVGAVLCLMLFSYHRLERSAKLPNKALYPISGLLGCFFCVAAARQGEFTLFFLAAAFWMAAEMTGLTPAEA